MNTHEYLAKLKGFLDIASDSATNRVPDRNQALSLAREGKDILETIYRVNAPESREKWGRPAYSPSDDDEDGPDASDEVPEGSLLETLDLHRFPEDPAQILDLLSQIYTEIDGEVNGDD